jgi:hypothetical protein
MMYGSVILIRKIGFSFLHTDPHHLPEPSICNYDIIVNDLWELDLSTWTWHKLFPTLARDRFAGIFDESSQEVVFFGGGTDGQLYMFDDGFRILVSSGSPTFGNGDVNCDGARNSADVIYLINYLFLSGPEPCANR